MSSSTLRPGAEIFVDSQPLELALGGVIEEPRVAYELIGAADAPIVVVVGGISAGSHVCGHARDPDAGWWEAIVGEGRALDLTRWRVLGIDWIGGAGASTGPVRGSGELFPPVTSHDQAAVLRRLLEAIGGPTARFEALVGSSYGGMVALAFAEAFPADVDKILVLCAAHTSDPWTTGARALSRRVLRLGIEGRAIDGVEREAISIARGLGMLSYRTREEFIERFETTPSVVDGRVRFEVESYLEARGRAFVRDFGAEALHGLSESIDVHRVDPKQIPVDTYLAAAPSDMLVPIATVRELANSLPAKRRFVEIDSLFGHDAFLKEVEIVGEFVRDSLGGVS